MDESNKAKLILGIAAPDDEGMTPDKANMHGMKAANMLIKAVADHDADAVWSAFQTMDMCAEKARPSTDEDEGSEAEEPADGDGE